MKCIVYDFTLNAMVLCIRNTVMIDTLGSVFLARDFVVKVLLTAVVLVWIMSKPLVFLQYYSLILTAIKNQVLYNNNYLVKGSQFNGD